MGETMLKNVVSEFIGTFMLVFTVGCNVMTGGKDHVFGVASIAAALMTCIYALGSVSGAHFNPAVTVACWGAGAMGKEGAATKALTYIVTQLVAGIIAGFSTGAMFGSFNLQPQGDYHWGGAMVAETLYTFMLCFVVLRAAVSSMNPASNEYFGLAIGFVIIAGGYGAGAISGGAFNPAVAFGIDVPSAGLGFGWSFAYLAFELLGAVLAVVAHKLVDVPASGDAAMSATGRNFVSEFLGTFFLVLTVGLNVLHGSKAAAFSIAASLMCMIYALGGVSGGHFNPAVTTALVLAKKAEAKDMPLYFAAQLLGGIVAGLTYMSTVGKAFPLGPNTAAGYNWTDAAVAEIVFTFLLSFVVLNTAALTGAKDMTAGGKATQVYGLAIGFTIVAGGFAIGGVSGGSLNPAVSFGIDTAAAVKGSSWSNCLAYTAFELIGGALAAGVFHVVRDEEFKKESLLGSKQASYGAA